MYQPPTNDAHYPRRAGRPTCKTVLAATTAIAVAMLMAACGSASTNSGATSKGGKSLTNVTLIEGAHVVGYSPVYLAMKAGYFAAEGLRVNLITAKSSSEATAAVVGGSAIAGLTASTDALDAIHSGNDLKLVYSLSDQWGLVLTVSDKYAKAHGLSPSMPLSARLAALKGAKIGVSAAGSATDLAVRVMLRDAGLNPDKDVTIVPIGSAPAAALAALQHGAINGFMFSPPFGNLAQAQRIGMPLIDLNTGEVPAFHNALFQDVVTSGSTLSSHRSEIVAIGKALARAEQTIAKGATGPPSGLTSAFPGVSAGIIDAAYKTTKPGFAAAPVPVTTASVEKDIEALGLRSSLTPKQSIAPISLGAGG